MVIRVMAPDLAVPSGGIKVMYRFVENLRALGHDARVWHGTPGFAFADWHSTAPVETGLRVRFDPGDVLVMAEVGRWDFLTKGKPVVILCQGVDFVFASSDFLVDEPGAYPAWPSATSAIATSESIRAFLTAAARPTSPSTTSRSRSRATSSRGQATRRSPSCRGDGGRTSWRTVHLLRRSGMSTDWEIVLIDGMSQADVASALGSRPSSSSAVSGRALGCRVPRRWLPGAT